MTYNGRRGPNVSEYIANLNAIPSAQDIQTIDQQSFNFDDDLALFTNTNFFDFDQGQGRDVDLPAPSYGGDGMGGPAAMTPGSGELKPLDYNTGEKTLAREPSPRGLISPSFIFLFSSGSLPRSLPTGVVIRTSSIVQPRLSLRLYAQVVRGADWLSSTAGDV